MAAHALLSASGAARWMTCTPSARLEEVLPDPPRRAGSKDFAAEGTLCHDASEAMLNKYYERITQEEFDTEWARIVNHELWSDELKAAADDYCLYVRSQVGEADQIFVEQKVDYSEYAPGGFGTADCVIIRPGKIHVIDLKAGVGVPVDAKSNPQLRLYALGAYLKFNEWHNFHEVEYTIVQPRLNSITSEVTTIKELVDWANTSVKPAAKRAWAGVGEFVPSEKGCQFCKAKSTCRARADFVMSIERMDFAPPATLDDDALRDVLDRAKQLNAWVNDVENYLLDRAIETGVTPPGYELGQTNKHRMIMDQGEVVNLLLSNGFKPTDIYSAPSLKTVAQLEKLGKDVKGMISQYVIKPEGEPKLVKSKVRAEEFK